MKFQDALLSDKIFNFIDIPANKYKDKTGTDTSFVAQYVRSIGASAFENNKGLVGSTFSYCTSIGAKAFYNASTGYSDSVSSSWYDLKNLTFNNVKNIPANAFYLYDRADGDSYGTLATYYRQARSTVGITLKFGNVGTIANSAFATSANAYGITQDKGSNAESRLDLTFGDVDVIEHGAFTVSAVSSSGTSYSGTNAKAILRLSFGNVKTIKNGIFDVNSSCQRGSDYATKEIYLSFKNVETIENSAFGGNMITSLSIPNKFRTRAELVRIGVGNPDSFKID
ncbi:hypothetical protein A9K75_08710 [Campylobacter fetus subsp. testudinum]|uniref:leucine-rich repeat protein n=1 Tax=Campylobacter fetus TaxID=196 RepID=UPI00081874AF|nr:leucine-rich repeat protein [Campylobacter fetus]OCR99043.1 hypothetical protein A9K75_08710 [Campylobacter fetus subsp. testudinum]